MFISQASLTGESEPIEKFPEVQGQQFRKGSVIELDNICYMGSNVISGAAKGIVFETGNKTYLGTIAKSLVGHRATTAFDKGISKVSFLLIRFMPVSYTHLDVYKRQADGIVGPHHEKEGSFYTIKQLLSLIHI